MEQKTESAIPLLFQSTYTSIELSFYLKWMFLLEQKIKMVQFIYQFYYDKSLIEVSYVLCSKSEIHIT